MVLYFFMFCEWNIELNLLLTAGRSAISQHLAEVLGARYQIVLTDEESVCSRHFFVKSDLNHGSETRALVDGVDVIIWSSCTDQSKNISTQIDRETRCLYNLLWAAWEAGVYRVVYLSSLAVMDLYPSNFMVTERWRPWPNTIPPTLTHHLGEIVCREFARERKLQIICLRLGKLLWSQGKVPTDGLTMEDLIQAVFQSLTVELPTYSVFHIQSSVPGQRYSTEKAQRVLGYEPSWEER